MSGPASHAGISGRTGAPDSDSEHFAPESVGKTGVLRVAFHDDGAGKTVISDQFSKVPLHAQRAMHYDDSCPGMAHMYIASVSGGILQGDKYRIDIAVGKGAMAHVTTQGATRVYGMDHGMAVQQVSAKLEDGAYLEFVPDQIIPYGGSRFRQETSLQVHDSATAVCSEIVAPGRVAMGEAFEYDLCHLKIRAANQDNVLRLIDAARLEPKRQRLGSFGVMGKHAIVGSAYILTRKNVQRLHDKINASISANADIAGGASTARGGGLLVRVLGAKTETVKGAILDTVGHARQECAGGAFKGIRKC